MSLPEPVQTAIDEYQTRYRNPQLPRLEVSGLYALRPVASHDPRLAWPEEWPSSGRPGVYIIFGADHQILYIGRADVLGVRLGNYFAPVAGRGSACRVKSSDWGGDDPAFVGTVAVTHRFEASSFEEFLIEKLQPRTNSRGKATGRGATSQSDGADRDG